MSMQPQSIPPVPPDSEAVARAAFPKGNIYLLLGDHGLKVRKVQQELGLEEIPQRTDMVPIHYQHLENEENEAAIAQGLLIVVDFESEEEAESFVNYATVLDEGESATDAIAVHRGWRSQPTIRKQSRLLNGRHRTFRFYQHQR
ncbi:hypothetical protein QUA43_13155 [Microcoleus sp. N9_B4]|jgi:hypothetical protein|uniref:hypothetical protein n=1 Tax=Microcoleus sp. N9_B4 TaxID=3055386 RepID=UPI002FD67212